MTTIVWNDGKPTEYKLKVQTVTPVVVFGKAMLHVIFADGSYLHCEKLEVK